MASRCSRHFSSVVLVWGIAAAPFGLGGSAAGVLITDNCRGPGGDGLNVRTNSSGRLSGRRLWPLLAITNFCGQASDRRNEQAQYRLVSDEGRSPWHVSIFIFVRTANC